MKVIRRFFFAALLLLAVPLAFNALTYINFNGSYGFLRLKQEAIASGWYLPAYYAHVLAAGVVLLAGIFQIHPASRTNWPHLHRALGTVYVWGILVLAAPGGLIMSFFIERGPWVQLSFLLQCTLWFVCTYLAYTSIRKQNIPEHRKWMLRSYALTLAAITLRLYVFVSSTSVDLSQATAYASIAWMSWVPNLVACEIYLWRGAGALTRRNESRPGTF